MYHVFLRDENHQYIDEYDSKEAKEALENGVFYVKINGSNNMLVKSNVDEKWYCYQRYNDKRGKYDGKENNLIDEQSGLLDICDLRPGNNPSVYRGTQTSKQQVHDEKSRKHHYYYVLRERTIPGVKSRRPCKVNKRVYQVIDNSAVEIDQKFSDLQENNDGKQTYMTVELIGKKFNKTLGVDEDVAIAIHSDQRIDIEPERRSFDGIKAFLLSFICEGLVVEHNGTFWKILTENFDENSNFSKLRNGLVKDNTNHLQEDEFRQSFIPPVVIGSSSFSRR